MDPENSKHKLPPDKVGRAFLFSLIGGIVDVATSLVAIVGSQSNSQPILLGEIGAFFGASVITSALMLRLLPLHHRLWATFVILFSILGIYGSAGGLVIGLALGVVGGVLGFRSTALIAVSSNSVERHQSPEPKVQEIPIIDLKEVGNSQPIYVSRGYIPQLALGGLWFAISAYFWYGYTLGGYVEQGAVDEYILIGFWAITAASFLYAIHGATFRFYWDHFTVHRVGSVDLDVSLHDVQDVSAVYSTREMYEFFSRPKVVGILLQIRGDQKKLRTGNPINRKNKLRLYDWLTARLNNRETVERDLGPSWRRPSHRKAFYASVAVIVIAFAFIGTVVYVGITHPYWAYNGAYLDYYGSAKLGDGNIYSYSLNMTVIEGALGNSGSTYAKVTIWSKLTSPLGSETNQSTVLVELQRKNTNPFTVGTPITTNSTHIILQDRVLAATAYSYGVQQFNESTFALLTNFTSYENACGVDIPVMFTFNTAKGGDLTIYPISTNIAGVLPSFPQAEGGLDGASGYCP